jgi:thymidylate synthase
MQADTTIVAESLDQALSQTLKQVIEQGSRLSIGGRLSIAAGRTTFEILNHSVRVTNPRRRFPSNPEYHFNPVAAVSRFVWMMSGSDRVSDIISYQPKVTAFSDDGLTISGSSYGHRLLASRPGLNQLTGVIERLKEDPHSRRAFVSIYQPEDAVRESKDIPCLLGLGYHIREGRLHASTFMRANNAYSLFPYNFFEFSLLGEIIAIELGVELGPLTHSAFSLHIYEEEVEPAAAVVRAGSAVTGLDEINIPPQPLATVRRLVNLEPLVRTIPDAGSSRLNRVLAAADEQLTGIWREMFQVLVIHMLLVSKRTLEATHLIENLSQPWRRYLSPRAHGTWPRGRVSVSSNGGALAS